jgi:hypothetical protein
MLMLTIEGLVAVFSLILAAFGLGYTIGHNDMTQKEPPPTKESAIL